MENDRIVIAVDSNGIKIEMDGDNKLYQVDGAKSTEIQTAYPNEGADPVITNELPTEINIERHPERR